MGADDKKRWQSQTLAASLARQGPRKDPFTRSGGEAIADVYASEDLSPALEGDLGFPGEYPFTRGVYPSMYRSRFWTMRQYAGFGSAAETNSRFRYLLEQGQTGLSTAFDLPTQMGYDSDHELATGEVGRVGVAIDTLEDMEALLSGIPLDRASTSMTINSTASTLLALYVAVAKRQGVDVGKLRGTIQNDILKEYIARGTYIYPPRPSMRVVTDIFRWCAEHAPRWNTISISGYHIREAGSTAAQEIAFTLADGIAYVEAALEAGLEVDTFAPRLSFFFNAHNDFLEEIAKFRAARRLWARLMKQRFGAKNQRSMMLRFHTQTAGSTLTEKHIDNNVVRVTLQALAAVLGGTQSLHTNGRDEALALPTQESARLALRTQQVIANESGVSAHVDPLAGSYAIERLTDELEASAIDYIQQIDSLGGMVAAIEQGFPQREIQSAAYAAQMALETGDQVVLGVNAYAEGGEHQGEILRIDQALETEQIERLERCRAQRDGQASNDAIDALQQAAAGDENVMPRILHAVESQCTLGEIADTLRGVFGVYREQVVI